jgi:hypothetical protein
MIGKRHLWFPVIALLAGLCLSCGQNKGTEPDDGTLFKAELEHYLSSFDDDASQVPINSSGCTSASNDSTVSGLDIAGEWIMVSVNVPQDGSYRPHLGYASNPGAVISLRLEMDGCGSSTTANFLLTQGSGMG